MTRPSARDRDAAVEILQHASFLQALTLTATRAAVLRGADSRRELADRFVRIGAAAGRLSKAFRERLDAPWPALERAVATAQHPDTDDQLKELWAAIRKVVRPLAATLTDAVGDEPAAAFSLDPALRSGPRAAPPKRPRKRA